MAQRFKHSCLLFPAALAALILSGCSPSGSAPTGQLAVPPASNSPAERVNVAPGTATDQEHGHQGGRHGGTIVSLGRDSYHVEAIVSDTGQLRLYSLGNDETRVLDIEKQELKAFVKAAGSAESSEISIQPQPQPGDADGKSSLFVAQLPASLMGVPLEVTVPNISIGGERFRLGFTTQDDSHSDSAMPAKVANEQESQLYLTPGGKYTEADIEANGRQTASSKFANFQAVHDLKPKPGDKICPVTLTKANPKCSWIIDGKTYDFCCPPCVDEFVKLAKNQPDELKAPEVYVKQPVAAAQ